MTPTMLQPLLLIALWLSLNGFIVFFLQLCFGIFTPWVTVVSSLITLSIIIYKYKKVTVTFLPLPWFVLGIIAFFLTMHSLYYPLGGWDAWSCWNLKAKFIYLGHERFREMFEPQLWRSNTQYPLLLPSINVWFWDLVGGAHTWGPMVISITITTLTAAILLFAILELTKHLATAIIFTGAIFLLPFNTTLCAGQYSDILVGLYLLCAFICFQTDHLKWMSVFLGLLSFTKTEGTVAAFILGVMLLWYHRARIKTFLPYLMLSMLPVIIFTLWMAPHNEAFVNGLTSSIKPSTWQRLQVILAYPLFEIISIKWNGLWIILLTMIAVYWGKLTQKRLQIFGIFFAVFLAILLSYYQVNTFFDIKWWLDTTLHRILFMLMPSLFLWVALAI